MTDSTAIAHHVISRAITHLSKDCPQDTGALLAITVLLAARSEVLRCA